MRSLTHCGVGDIFFELFTLDNGFQKSILNHARGEGIYLCISTAVGPRTTFLPHEIIIVPPRLKCAKIRAEAQDGVSLARPPPDIAGVDGIGKNVTWDNTGIMLLLRHMKKFRGWWVGDRIRETHEYVSKFKLVCRPKVRVEYCKGMMSHPTYLFRR